MSHMMGGWAWCMQWGGCGACSGVGVVHAVGWVWCMQWGGCGGVYSGVGVVHAVSNTRMQCGGCGACTSKVFRKRRQYQ